MAFSVFQDLFAEVDAATSVFVSDVVARLIVELTPVVTVGLSLAFIVYGLAIIRGAIDLPVMNFLGRAVQIGIITSIALAGGLYQARIAAAIQTVPDAFTQAILSDPSAVAANVIDAAGEKGLNRATEAFEKSALFSSDGIAYLVLAVIYGFSTAIMLIVGGGLILMAKFMLALLAAFGPMAILALLFEPTRQLFDRWMGQIVGAGLTIVFVGAIFGLLLSIYGRLMDGLDWGTTNIGWHMGGAIIITGVGVMVLLQASSIAAALGGGLSLGLLHEARAVRGMAGATARGARSAVNNRLTRAAVNNPATRAAASGVAAAGRRAVGYFKGARRDAA